MQASYRSFQDFSWEALDAAKTARSKLKKKFAQYADVKAADGLKDDISYLTDILTDDLDTPKMLARLRAGLDALDEELASAIRWLDENVLKLGLFVVDIQSEAPEHITALAQERREAKLAKDFAKADALRTQLTEAGWEMREGKDEYTLSPL